jgi:hypothetical protein
MAAPVVLPTAAAATAFEALMRQFEGARSQGASIQYMPARRRLRGKQSALAIEGGAAPMAIEDAPPERPRRRLRGKQPPG